jgi:hypothetical protein
LYGDGFFGSDVTAFCPYRLSWLRVPAYGFVFWVRVPTDIYMPRILRAREYWEGCDDDVFPMYDCHGVTGRGVVEAVPSVRAFAAAGAADAACVASRKLKPRFCG